MERLQINGGRRLEGTVTVSGAKNAAVAILPASLLCGGVCVIENLPRIDDVLILRDIFSEMGVDVSLEGDRMTVDSSRMTNHKADFELVSCMRASYYLLGAMLGRFGRRRSPCPAAATLETGPSTCTSRAWRPWVQRPASRGAFSGRRPPTD